MLSQHRNHVKRCHGGCFTCVVSDTCYLVAGADATSCKYPCRCRTMNNSVVQHVCLQSSPSLPEAVNEGLTQCRWREKASTHSMGSRVVTKNRNCCLRHENSSQVIGTSTKAKSRISALFLFCVCGSNSPVLYTIFGGAFPTGSFSRLMHEFSEKPSNWRKSKRRHAEDESVVYDKACDAVAD